MIAKELIFQAVEGSIRDTGFFLVDVSVTRGNLIQVFLDHPDGISLDDCAALSGKIEQQLNRDVEDFELQVSSPGLGQPIKVIQQYRKAVGEKLVILLADGGEVRGTLESFREETGQAGPALVVRLAGTKKKPAPAEPVVIDTRRIHSARVVVHI